MNKLLRTFFHCMERLLCISLLLFFFLGPTKGQPERDSINLANHPSTRYLNTKLSFRLSDFGSPNNIYSKTLNDFGKVFNAPFRWKKESYIKFGAIMAGGVTLYMFDENIYNVINRHKTEQTRFFTKYVLEPTGNYTSYTLLAVMAGYGLITNKERPTTTAILCVESLLLSGAITLIPKTFAGRVRPKHSHPLSASEWRGFMGGRSFWSGHTIAAFSVATVIADMNPDRPFVHVIAYSTATLAGISRMHDQKHWASDVFFGAVVGTAIGKMVVRTHKINSLSLVPYLTPDNMGLHFSLKF